MILQLLMITKSDLQIKSNRKGELYKQRQEALEFVQSEWFEALCMAMKLDPSAVRERLMDGKHLRAVQIKKVNMA